MAPSVRQGEDILLKPQFGAFKRMLTPSTPSLNYFRKLLVNEFLGVNIWVFPRAFFVMPDNQTTKGFEVSLCCCVYVLTIFLFIVLKCQVKLLG